MKAIGLILFFVICAFYIDHKAGFKIFIDLSSMAFVISTTIVLGLAKNGFSETKKFSNEVARSLIWISLLSGCIGSTIAFVQVLHRQLDNMRTGIAPFDSEMSTIPEPAYDANGAFASSALPILYAMILVACIYVYKNTKKNSELK